jgi:hypothetical protein
VETVIKGQKVNLLSLLMILAISLMLRATCGYRPYPSIDDFAYIPQNYAKLDHQLFRSDFLVQNTSLHLPLYPALLYGFDQSIGAPLGFWVLTFVLSVFTVGAIWGLFKALGGGTALFPLAALLALVPRLPGLGRGLYDGAFGDAFHMQWVALCILLWVFLALVRRRIILAGLLLGACIWAHPVVGVHGAFCLAVAVMAASPNKISDLARLAAASGCVSAPVILVRIFSLISQSRVLGWSARDLIHQGYLYRTPQEFSFAAVSLPFLLLLVLLGFSGLTGALALSRLRKSPALPVITGIYLGEGLILAAAVLLHGHFLPASWEESFLLPYLLHLTRSSPLFVAVASILAVAGLEAVLAENSKPQQFRGEAFSVLRFCFLIVMALLILTFITWDLGRLAVSLLGLLYGIGIQRKSHSVAAFMAGALISASAALIVIQDRLEAPVPQEEKELFDWVRAQTDRDALFIIPVGFQQFRFYTLRSVYVDFKLFPASTPTLIPEWRRRLELVAAPDKKALGLSGWEAVPYLDRTYAQRNTPERIAWLLKNTGAKYFVWDSSCLDVPPFLDLPRPASGALQVLFANPRFGVYRLAGPIG